MGLNALLMCRDQQSLRVLRSALDVLDIEQEACASAPDAMELMTQGYYSALVLDFDLPNAALAAKMARLAPAQRRPVVFAMIGALTEIAAAFQAGANFVVYKPLVLEQVLRSLRAGKVFMRPDRRSSPRQKLETLVYLQFGIAALPAMVLDLNEQGISLQSPEPLPALQQVPLRFVLPGTSHMIEGTGEMIWADDNGRAGMFFSRLTAGSRKHLKQWLGKRGAKNRTLERVTRHEKPRRLEFASR